MRNLTEDEVSSIEFLKQKDEARFERELSGQKKFRKQNNRTKAKRKK